ncbi:MAG: RNA-binding S4 domain-containing protein [Thiohalocapsa sp.]
MTTATIPTATGASAERAKARLDQWLWFARFVKSRSLAARLCSEGTVSINELAVKKANQAVRVGDVVVITYRGVQRSVRVLALGARRGPASEARLLYEETAPPLRLPHGLSDWIPLLDDEDAATDCPIP